MTKVYVSLTSPIEDSYPMTLSSLASTISNMVRVGGIDIKQKHELCYQLYQKHVTVTFSSEIANLPQGNQTFTLKL